MLVGEYVRFVKVLFMKHVFWVELNVGNFVSLYVEYSKCLNVLNI